MFVSSVDIYYSCKYHESLADMEQNPIGSWLIAQNDGISLFMGLKSFGTWMAFVLALLFFLINDKLSILATFVVFIFQVWLFCYLSF